MTPGGSATARPQNPDLLRAKAVLGALLAALRSAPATLPPGVPNREAAALRLASGIPALTGEPLVSWAGLAHNARAIAAGLAGTEAGDAARTVADRLGRIPDGLDRETLASVALAGAWDATADLAHRLDLDGDALITVLDYAARPALRAGADDVRALVAEARWTRGTCPACGAPPTLSVVQGKEHERRLHCGRCNTAWPYLRVRCPACGEGRHEQLGNLHAEGEGEYRRAEVCESCRGYVKSVALLDVPDADRLLELDLETAGLDFLALEQGYTRNSELPSR
jgi:FdhE protein